MSHRDWRENPTAFLAALTKLANRYIIPGEFSPGESPIELAFKSFMETWNAVMEGQASWPEADTVDTRLRVSLCERAYYVVDAIANDLAGNFAIPVQAINRNHAYTQAAELNGYLWDRYVDETAPWGRKLYELP